MEYLILLPCFFVSVFLVFLIRNRFAFCLPALLGGILLSIYSPEYLICFFPSVCWIILLKSAGFINTDRAVGYDGFFWTFLLSDAVVSVLALVKALQYGARNVVFSPRIVFVFVFSLFLLVGVAVPPRLPVSGKRKKEGGTFHSAKKTRIALFCGLFGFPGVIIYCWSFGGYISLFTLPVFTCFCAALLSDGPLYVLLRRDSSG